MTSSLAQGAYRFASEVVDDLVTAVLVVAERRRGFSRPCVGPPPTFDGLLEAMRAAPTAVRWPGGDLTRPTRLEVALPAFGTRSFCDFRPAPGGGADTLVVYHHGLGEIPHDLNPRALARLHAPLGRRCDWVVLKGLHHETPARVSERLTADRDEFVRSLLASASTARAVARELRPRYRHLLLCGVSMGGVITLVEAMREPRFDLYAPLVAGPDLADVLLESRFSRLVQGAFRRQARRSGWIRELDLTARLAASEGPPIRPLLARSDRLFRVEVQRRALARVARARVSEFEGGHLTGAANVLALGRHLVRILEEERWGPAAAAAGPALELRSARPPRPVAAGA